MSDLEPYRFLTRESTVDHIELWSATDLRIGRKVLVEIAPRPENWSEARLAARLRIASELRHAALLTALDAGFDSERMFAVYPCFEARSVEGAAAPTVKEALRAACELAQALAAAHRAGLLHGDLHARWIEGEPKSSMRLLGFGIPRDPWAEGSLIDRGRSSDIAALANWLQSILPPLSTQPRGLSKSAWRDLKEVLLAALRGDSGGGYSTADAFAGDLSAILQDRPVSVRPIGRFALLKRHLVRERRLCALGFITVSALIAGAFCLGILIETRDESLRAAEWQRRIELEAQLEEGFLLLAQDRNEEAYQVLNSRHFGPLEDAAAWARALAMSRGSVNRSTEPARTVFSDARLPTRGLQALAKSFSLHPFEDSAAELGEALRETQLAIALGGPGVRLAWIARGRLSLSDPSWSDSFARDVLRLFPEDDRLLVLTLRTDPESEVDIEARALQWLQDPRRSAELRRGSLRVLAKSKDPEHRDRVQREIANAPWLNEIDRREIEIQLALASGDVEFARGMDASIDIETAPASLVIAYGRALLSARRSDEASLLASQGILRWPHRRELRFIHLASLEQGKQGRDLAPYRELVHSWPGALGPRAIYGRCAYAIGAYAEGLTAIAGGIPWQPHAHTPYSDIAFGLLELGRHAEARAWIEAVRALAIDEPILQLYEARALARLGRQPEARAILAALGEEPAADPDFRRIRGLLLARDLGDRAAAATDLEAAAARDPSHREVGVQRAIGFQLAGKNQEAFEALKALLEHHPSDAWILERLAHLARATGQPELRRGYLERAASARPSEANLQSALALELASSGDQEGALRAHLAAIERNPWSAEAWCNLGLFHEQRGAIKESVQCLRRGHALGLRRSNWRYPSANWLARCEAKLREMR